MTVDGGSGSEAGDGRRPIRVLFVCTANIARSPYAERRARAMLGEAPVEVVSAGVPGRWGRGMDAELAARLAADGVPAEGHRSQGVTAELLADADLVLTFEFGQRLRLVEGWPQHATKVLGFNQFAEALRGLPERAELGEDWLRLVRDAAPPDSMALDVEDPHGQGARAAAACGDEIDAGLGVIVPWLATFARAVSRREKSPVADSVGSRVAGVGSLLGEPATDVGAPPPMTVPAVSGSATLAAAVSDPAESGLSYGRRTSALLVLFGALALLGGVVGTLAGDPTASGVGFWIGVGASVVGVVAVVTGIALRTGSWGGNGAG